MKLRHVRIIVLMALTMVGSHGYGNGINPPPPTGGTILVATCVDRNTKVPTVVFRVRAVSSDTTGSVMFRLPSSGSKKLTLSDIRRVEIPRVAMSQGGYTSASVDLLNPEFQGIADIRLGRGKTGLRLTGFNESRERVTVRVSTCEVLEIQRSSAAEQGIPQNNRAKD